MKKTIVDIPALHTVDYSQSICFLGSCFSENISKKAESFNFDASSNPLGVIFNPMSLGKYLLEIKDDSENYDIVKRNDVYFSWEANSSVYGYSEEELRTCIQNARLSFKAKLSDSSTLFITLGTAWVYELKESGQIVANCHKFDQTLFNKRLLSISEIVEKWKQVIPFLTSEYPNLNIVFTLSPVRHLKDGLIDNARGKAILLESIHQIVDEFKNCHYFPAYEIVLDELRDYGYYTKDGLHPNEIAIDKVWSSFFEALLSLEAQKIAAEWSSVRNLLNHKVKYENSEEAKKFLKHRDEQLANFKSKYPSIKIKD